MNVPPRQNRMLAALSEPLFERLKARLRPMPMQTGTVLFAAGDQVANMYFPGAGAISLVTDLAGGQMVESAMIGRDSVVGGGAALDDREAVYKAIVQVEGSAWTLDVDAVRQIARDSEEFRRAIMAHEQLIMAQAHQSAACNATHNLHERLARWLLRVRDVTDSHSFVLTQEFIAEMLGVGRTSVSLVAHALQEAGMINYSRGHIRILNAEALQDSACECDATVRARYERLFQSQGAVDGAARR